MHTNTHEYMRIQENIHERIHIQIYTNTAFRPEVSAFRPSGISAFLLSKVSVFGPKFRRFGYQGIDPYGGERVRGPGLMIRTGASGWLVHVR